MFLPKEQSPIKYFITETSSEPRTPDLSESPQDAGSSHENITEAIIPQVERDPKVTFHATACNVQSSSFVPPGDNSRVLQSLASLSQDMGEIRKRLDVQEAPKRVLTPIVAPSAKIVVSEREVGDYYEKEEANTPPIPWVPPIGVPALRPPVLPPPGFEPLAGSVAPGSRPLPHASAPETVPLVGSPPLSSEDVDEESQWGG